MLYNPATGTTTPLTNGATFPYGAFFLVRADVAGLWQGSATGNITLPTQVFLWTGAPSASTPPRTQRDPGPRPRHRHPRHHRRLLGRCQLQPQYLVPLRHQHHPGPDRKCAQVSAPVLSAASTLTFTALINARGYGAGQLQGYGTAAPTGTVTFSSGNAVLGTAASPRTSIPPSPGTAVGPPSPFLPVGCRLPPTQLQPPTRATPTTHPPPPRPRQSRSPAPRRVQAPPSSRFLRRP